MANASRDQNNKPGLIGVSSSNGATIIRVKADTGTNAILGADGTTGTDFGSNVASKDDNSVSTILAVSSVDGITPVEIYVDSSTGQLLIKST